MRGLGLALRGEREEGLRWVSQAFARCEEGGALSFNGAWILAGWALLETDPARREELLRQGERLLASGSVSHSHLHFYELGIECSFETCNFDQAERYAKALARYVARESVPFAQLVIDRAHALCAWGRGVRSREVRGKLKSQLDRARSAGLMVAVPRLVKALEDRKL